MLEKVVLNNYTTFVNETTIDFLATNYKFLENENVGNNRVLKGALFVGENASGKTQILKAINFLLELLFSNSEIDFMSRKSFYTTKNNYNLKYYFLVDDYKLSYELEFSVDKVVKEKLCLNNQVILDRIGSNAEFIYNDKKYFKDLSDKLLFLRRIYFDTHFYDDKILNKWFDFLKNSVYVNCYNREIFNFSNSVLLEDEYYDKSGTSEINEFFNEINYNQKIAYDVETPDNGGIFKMKSNNNDKFLSFIKDGTNVYIPDIFESTGNNTLIHLLPVFLHATKNECMIIVDEFSSGLHNELEECLIKYFNHYSKNSQLFFTSHSTNILNNTIIRPDQVYSVSFKGKKGSSIKRFSDEMPREAQNTEKMYLNGVFDGMPRYNKVFKD